jgi:hypothetical protein
MLCKPPLFEYSSCKFDPPWLFKKWISLRQYFGADVLLPPMLIALWMLTSWMQSGSKVWNGQKQYLSECSYAAMAFHSVALYYFWRLKNIFRIQLYNKQVCKMRWICGWDSHTEAKRSVACKAACSMKAHWENNYLNKKVKAPFKVTVSWDRFQKFWPNFKELDLTKRRGWCLKFLGAFIYCG